MRLALIVLVLALAADAAAAPPPADTPLPPVHAVRLDRPITLDGALDEPVWKTAPPVTHFVVYEPVEGSAASESTEVRVAYDDDALYVGFRCWDSHPDSIVARLVRRDTTVPADRVMVYLDPFHDRRSGYYFGVNASGVLYDGTLFNDDWDDNSWDGVWQGKARVDDKGWTCEMRIPYSQMRCRDHGEDVWGINFSRIIQRRAERSYCSVRRHSESGFVSRFMALEGLADLHRTHSVEVTPYMTGKAQYQPIDRGDPFHGASDYTPGLGGDLRTGVGQGLTLNATVNPDFGQVEVDPAVVNLSDVESYFQEKRPFFTENSRVFSFGNEGASDYWGFNWSDPTFFYSRRIGRSPQGALPDAADFVDVPVATHILGAAKLTGKLAPGWNFGTMQALTSRENGQFDIGGLRGTQEVEPFTYYGLARGQHEFRERRNGLGAMVSVVQRRFGDDVLPDQLNRQSLVTGLDGWHFLDAKKVWVVSGWAAMSRIAGNPTEMTAVQTNSRHYLQRPDTRALGVDSTATSLTGHGVRLWVNKQEGAWLFNSAAGYMSPKLDLNDMGFMRRADVINEHFGGGYRWAQAGRFRKYAHWIGALFASQDFEGDRVWSGAWTGAHADMRNNWSYNGTFAWNPTNLDNRRTRGGPLMIAHPGIESSGEIDTDTNRPLSYVLTFYTYDLPDARAFDYQLNPYVEWKPVSNFTISMGPGLERNVDDAQYLTTISAPGEVPAGFGGDRYVFGRLDQTTFSAQIRLNVSLTPNLSLQTYLQPLISVGRYTDIKELARARSYDFVHYDRHDGGSGYDRQAGLVTPANGGTPFELSDPNFNIHSLRGNAVLRWEYRPGSTLYLVWTQERALETDGYTAPDFAHSFNHVLPGRPDDIFLAKVTYYLNF